MRRWLRWIAAEIRSWVDAIADGWRIVFTPPKYVVVGVVCESRYQAAGYEFICKGGVMRFGGDWTTGHITSRAAADAYRDWLSTTAPDCIYYVKEA